MWTVDDGLTTTARMNNVEKHEVVREHLCERPEHSDRQIAGALGVSPTFVGKVRRYLEAKGRLTQVETRAGHDGRRRRRRRSPKEIQRDQLRNKLGVVERQLKERLERYEYDRIKRHEYHIWGFTPYPHELEAERDRIVAELESLQDAPG
jgi:hypothetical protein